MCDQTGNNRRTLDDYRQGAIIYRDDVLAILKGNHE